MLAYGCARERALRRWAIAAPARAALDCMAREAARRAQDWLRSKHDAGEQGTRAGEREGREEAWSLTQPHSSSQRTRAGAECTRSRFRTFATLLCMRDGWGAASTKLRFARLSSAGGSAGHSAARSCANTSGKEPCLVLRGKACAAHESFVWALEERRPQPRGSRMRSGFAHLSTRCALPRAYSGANNMPEHGFRKTSKRGLQRGMQGLSGRCSD
eukprot:2474285-Pleurochrysis_carterae.AAC.2